MTETGAEIVENIIKDKGASAQVILQDNFSDVEKMYLYFLKNYEGNYSDTGDWIVSEDHLLNMTSVAVQRALNKLTDCQKLSVSQIVQGETGLPCQVYTLFSFSKPRLVLFGCRPLSCDTQEMFGDLHFALKFVEGCGDPRSRESVWVEVSAKISTIRSNLIINDGNNLRPFGGLMKGVNSPSNTEANTILGLTTWSDVEIMEFCTKYVQTNPSYSVVTNNCQILVISLCNAMKINRLEHTRISYKWHH